MCQMTFLATLYINGVKNSQIIYLWMFKIPIFSVMPFPRFKKLTNNSFFPTFPKIWEIFLFTLFKTLISQKVCHFEQQNKIHIIRNKELDFFQFKWQRLIKYFRAYIFKCDSTFFPVGGSIKYEILLVSTMRTREAKIADRPTSPPIIAYLSPLWIPP